MNMELMKLEGLQLASDINILIGECKEINEFVEKQISDGMVAMGARFAKIKEICKHGEYGKIVKQAGFKWEYTTRCIKQFNLVLNLPSTANLSDTIRQEILPLANSEELPEFVQRIQDDGMSMREVRQAVKEIRNPEAAEQQTEQTQPEPQPVQSIVEASGNNDQDLEYAYKILDLLVEAYGYATNYNLKQQIDNIGWRNIARVLHPDAFPNGSDRVKEIATKLFSRYSEANDSNVQTMPIENHRRYGT